VLYLDSEKQDLESDYYSSQYCAKKVLPFFLPPN